MTAQNNRRSFIKKAAIGGLGITAAPTLLLKSGDKQDPARKKGDQESPLITTHSYNAAYTGGYLNRIAFPIGGIGAGMFCIEGSGAISHVSVRHHPQIFNEPGQFGALYIKGSKYGAKVLEGPVPDWKKYGLPGSGNGEGGTNYGLPRFGHATFRGRFPFCEIKLQDRDVPMDVNIVGWSPFIPTDPDNSSLPVGALEYYFENKSNEILDAIFSYNTRNFMRQTGGGKNGIQKMAKGLILSQEPSEDKPWMAGDFAIFTDDDNAFGDYCWFRGGWWDPLSVAWEDVKKGETNPREPVEADAPGASLFIPFTLKPGEKKVIRIMMAWYVPDSDLRIGKDATAQELEDKEKCDPSSGCCRSPNSLGIPVEDQYKYPKYKPWYSSKYKDVHAVVNYWKHNYWDLHRKSTLFKNAFYACTLPDEVIEAVAANLSIIKSPTVLRQADGRLWAFEGCSDNEGCCYGSCTHVWNYAQAIPHLFPSLERSLRETEFCENQSADGHQMFRGDIPIRPVHNDFYAAADGQLGGIMKVYRDWHISGDNAWMKRLFPMVKKSLDYCIETWDPQHQGIVKEPHHNTYDIEFWGPDGMCTSFYLGALSAFIKMGKSLNEDVSLYKDLHTKGKNYMEHELFNGEYFIQKIEYKDLKAANPVQEAEKSFVGKYSPEALRLLKKEGPKYQYGTGCLSDGIIGAWMSAMCMLENPIDSEKTKSHISSVYRYNFKKNLSEHANPQRPAYALGDEGGLLLCSWPLGGRLELPFVYSDEVWTGIEYQVASHLMLMGEVEEGLEIVRTCRDRYNGRIRNPFNEYECGNWYARAMSSYAMLQGLTGIRYDAIDKTLYIDSKIGDFTSFLSTETGFGNVIYKGGKVSLKIAYGHIEVIRIIDRGKQIIS